MTDLAADLMIANAEIEMLKAELAASRRRADAAVALIDEIRNDDTGDWDYIMRKIDKWRGPQAGEGERDV